MYLVDLRLPISERLFLGIEKPNTDIYYREINQIFVLAGKLVIVNKR
jgi:hypothetical protein